MSRLSFLGHTPMALYRRAFLEQIESMRQWLTEPYAVQTLVTHMQTSGFTNAEIQDVLSNPTGASRRLLDDAGDAPDLVDTLRDEGAPPSLLRDIDTFALSVQAAPARLRLDGCDRGGGTVAISYHVPASGASVQEGDLYFAGVCFVGSEETGEVTVAPRALRKICTNGMIQATNLTGREGVFVRDLDGAAQGTIEEAIQVGLSQANVTAVTDRLRVLVGNPADDPIEALARWRVRVPAFAEAGVRQRFRANGDTSTYGAFNALTETARDSQDVRQRIELERRAGYVLGVGARLEAPAPSDAGRASADERPALG